MARLVAKGSKTITALNDGYTVRLAPPAIIIPSNFDGSAPVLASAKTKVFLSLGSVNIPVNITGTIGSGCLASFSGNEATITSVHAEQGSLQISFQAADGSYSGSTDCSFALNKQGDSGHTVVFDNETVAIRCDENGNVLPGALDDTLCSIYAWRGATPLSSVAANATPGVGQFRYNITNTVGGTSFRNTNHNFRLLTVTADRCLVMVRIYLEGLSKYVTKQFVAVKVRAGHDGAPGAPGAPGPSGNTPEFRYQKNNSSTTPPSVQSTNTLPPGWALTVPAPSLGEYVWMIQALKTPAGALVGSWSNPLMVSGREGKQGPTNTFAGPYFAHVEYTGSDDLVQIVTYEGEYYITLTSAGSFSGIPPTNTGKWKKLPVEEIKVIASDLILAQETIIENLVARTIKTDGPGNARIEIDGYKSFVKLIDQNDRDRVKFDMATARGGGVFYLQFPVYVAPLYMRGTWRTQDWSTYNAGSYDSRTGTEGDFEKGFPEHYTNVVELVSGTTYRYWFWVGAAGLQVYTPSYDDGVRPIVTIGNDASWLTNLFAYGSIGLGSNRIMDGSDGGTTVDSGFFDDDSTLLIHPTASGSYVYLPSWRQANGAVDPNGLRSSPLNRTLIIANTSNTYTVGVYSYQGAIRSRNADTYQFNLMPNKTVILKAISNNNSRINLTSYRWQVLGIMDN